MKFLVFQHVPHENLGLIAVWAKTKSVELTIVEFWQPYGIPNPVDFDALIVLGGPMGVYDDFPSKNDELMAIKSVLDKDKPLLGICLGSQLLASALGAKVYKMQKNGRPVKEIGFYDVQLTDLGTSDPLFKGFGSPLKVLQWHGDTFDLPEKAILLATSPDCKNQAFKCQKAYGIQFHAEYTAEMVEKQILEDREWMQQDFQVDEEQLKQQSHAYEQLMKKQCEMLMDNFAQTI